MPVSKRENLDGLSKTASALASARGSRTEDIRRPNDWLFDPGLASEPVVIGLTSRATSIAEKHDASQERLTIGFDTGRNRATGFRALDHNHTHVSSLKHLPDKRGRSAGVRSCRCGLLGGASHLGRCSSKGQLARDDASPTDRILAGRILGILPALARQAYEMRLRPQPKASGGPFTIIMSKSLRLRAEYSARNEANIFLLSDRSANRITGLTPPRAIR